MSTFFDFPILYNVKSGQPLTNMAEADTMMAGCTALTINGNDRLVVSCSSDGSVRVSHYLLHIKCVKLELGTCQIRLECCLQVHFVSIYHAIKYNVFLLSF